MEFDKNKVYTTLNADELQVGSMIIGADNLEELKQKVHHPVDNERLVEVLPEDKCYRFITDERRAYALAHLVSAPAKLKWTDLKVGDIIRCNKTVAMVTAISLEKSEARILVGDTWLTDAELKYWEKVK